MKNLLKKSLSVLLALAAVFSVCVVAGAATDYIVYEEGSDYGVGWSLDTEGNLTVSGYGRMGSAYPPNPAKYPWFKYRNQIKTLTVEYGITSLGVSAFRSLPCLESVSLPVSLTTIDESTFSGCQLLSEISFPSSLTYIGSNAFSGCKSLSSSIVLPGVTVIGRYAFSNTGITGVSICSENASVFENAFRRCEKLESLALSSGIYAQKNIFDECFAINNVKFTGTREEWNSLPFVIGGNNSICSDDVECNAQCARHIEKMYVSNPPRKLIYGVGETLDLSGIELTVEWSDGTVEAVTDTAKINAWGFSSDYTGSVEVMVEYEGFATAFYIPVITEATQIISGSCGPHSKWTLDTRYGNTLTIDGKGDMYEFDSAEDYPWYAWGEKTYFLQTDGIDYISDNAFAGCVNLHEISVYNSPEIKIGDNAFGNEKSLYEVRFYGSAEEWCTLQVGENNDKLYTADEYYFNNELHAHSFEETVIEEASCVKNGLASVSCGCGYHGTKIIPAHGEHKLSTVTVDSTCTHTGKEYSVCEVCDRTIGGTTVLPLKNHTPGEWETDESGKTVKKCTECSMLLEEKEAEPEEVPEETPEEDAPGFDFVETISGIFKIITDYIAAFFDSFFNLLG